MILQENGIQRKVGVITVISDNIDLKILKKGKKRQNEHFIMIKGILH